MSLLIITPENKKEEIDIQQSINTSIDKNENIIFSSGAGSGKTYALVESLKYIVNRYGLRLKTQNQKIICITYTNVAVEEVKSRLGNSELVLVSTIHERVWELIKDYQKELLEIHKIKLTEEIVALSKNLSKESKFSKYRNLSESQKLRLCEIMIFKKDIFYKYYDENANNFRSVFTDSLQDYKDIFKNLADFKDLVKVIYKIDNYEECLEKIAQKEDKYQKVVYNASYNMDRLHWMRISHDTLLEYGIKIITTHNILQQIIIDKYPYFLIDEFQDTEKNVVKVMSVLSNRSTQIGHPFFVGYFGDPAQNIYDGGVGRSITDIHPNLKPILKKFNRRSHEEVINVINSIRNDEIKQESIYDDAKGGSIKFYEGARDKINDFIDSYVAKWNISVNNKLHCFVLTNKSVANFSGFNNIYIFFANSKKYKTAYKQLNSELLSDNISKLGEIPSFLYRIIEFKNKLSRKDTQVQDIVGKYIYADMDITTLRNFINSLKEINGETLKEFLESLKEFYENSKDYRYKLLVNKILDIEGFPNKSIDSYIMEVLYPNLKQEKKIESQKAISEFLNINISEFNLWYKYIIRESEQPILYHTYHGTKGLEFENVIIIMENAFGTNDLYFKFFFMQLLSNNPVRKIYEEEFEQTKNLLYVACSRSIKNLRILYLDNISDFKKSVEKIFINVDHY